MALKKICAKKPAKRRLLSRKAMASRGPSLRKATTSRRRVWSGKIVAKKRRQKPKIKIPRRTTKKSAQKIAQKIMKKRRLSYDNLKRSAKNRKEQTTTEFPAEALFRAKIKVIGIGGGGGSIVSEIGRSLEKATFVIADTDIRALKKKSGIKYFWFGQDLTHGLGTGVNVDLAKQAAESAREKISGFFRDQDIIIFVASLGGGLGSGAAQVFAEAAREFGGITFGIFTMPFKFEGKNKQRIAQAALKSLRKSLNVSLVIPNEKIFKIIGESTPITNAFSTVNKSLIESLESLIDLIYNPGIINIDFADLRTILSGLGNSAFLNTVEESGKNRTEKICEKIFRNPLLQNSGFTTQKILFNIAGAESLSMFEVEKISSHIANLHPKAKIIFGISKNAKLKNKIKTTILMTGAPFGSQVIKEAEPVKMNEPEVVAEKKKEPVAEKIIIKNKSKKIVASVKPKKSPPALPTGQAGGRQAKPRKVKKNNPVSLIPVFEQPVVPIPILEQRKIDIVRVGATLESELGKKAIRRSGLEIKRAEELEEKKKLAQEKEWEIPAFLRKIKFKN